MQEEKILVYQTYPIRGESYYDLWEDWELIESSFLKQYGIRLRSDDDMSYSEFCSLLAGIMPDTPLGQIVSIRAEKDSKNINAFTPEQKRIWREWQNRKQEHLKKNPQEYMDYWTKVQMELKNAFCNK